MIVETLLRSQPMHIRSALLRCSSCLGEFMFCAVMTSSVSRFAEEPPQADTYVEAMTGVQNQRRLCNFCPMCGARNTEPVRLK